MPRNGILSLAIDDLQVLHGAYMPFLKNGGLYIPAHSHYSIGSEILLILKLPNEADDLAVAGKVVWTTPLKTFGARGGGIGIQFNDRGSVLQSKIENLLEGQFEQEMATQTL